MVAPPRVVAQLDCRASVSNRNLLLYVPFSTSSRRRQASSLPLGKQVSSWLPGKQSATREAGKQSATRQAWDEGEVHMFMSSAQTSPDLEHAMREALPTPTSRTPC